MGGLIGSPDPSEATGAGGAKAEVTLDGDEGRAGLLEEPVLAPERESAAPPPDLAYADEKTRLTPDQDDGAPAPDAADLEWETLVVEDSSSSMRSPVVEDLYEEPVTKSEREGLTEDEGGAQIGEPVVLPRPDTDATLRRPPVNIPDAATDIAAGLPTPGGQADRLEVEGAGPPPPVSPASTPETKLPFEGLPPTLPGGVVARPRGRTAAAAALQNHAGAARPPGGMDTNLFWSPDDEAGPGESRLWDEWIPFFGLAALSVVALFLLWLDI